MRLRQQLSHNPQKVVFPQFTNVVGIAQCTRDLSDDVYDTSICVDTVSRREWRSRWTCLKTHRMDSSSSRAVVME